MDAGATVRADRPSVIDETFDGEAVVVHLGTGRYYALNAAATEVWELLRDGNSAAKLEEQLRERRGEDAAAWAARFLERLLEERLLVRGLAPPQGNGSASQGIDPPQGATTNGNGVTNGNGPSAESGAPPPWAEPPALQCFEDLQDLLLVDPIHDVTLGPDGWPVQAEQ